jgi:CRP-like cAMP-binding protein
MNMVQDPDDLANQLLLSLPEGSLQRLLPALELRAIERGQVINRADRPVEHLYFVNRGLISLVKAMRDGRTVEIGVVGIEGVSNALALFGLNKAHLECVVQVPGTAFRIAREALRQAVADDPAVQDALEKYSYFSVAAFAQTAACNRLHHLEERCCRWLLITHDNARTDTFQLTHEFLAMMLGVQRARISVVANSLQRAGLIQYRHGHLTVTDRAGLQRTACECYDAIRREYDKLFRRPKYVDRTMP